MSKKQLTIWFKNNGDMISQYCRWMDTPSHVNDYKSELAQDFDDRLQFISIVDYAQGATRVYFKSVMTGRQYSMFAEHFGNVIKNEKFQNNRLEGTFRFIKRGSGQAIELIMPEAPVSADEQDLA